MHYAGDAVLARFDAVVDAISGATAIQDKLQAQNHDLPKERKVQFRIGVNIGDVIEDRGDIYGDGVNVAARLEALAAQGLDGFRHYLLPHAALKLKQGFGRLIRSTADVGVVLLMDPRVNRRNYGGMLMASLPPATRVIGSWQEVRSAAQEFFQRNGIGAAV